MYISNIKHMITYELPLNAYPDTQVQTYDDASFAHVENVGHGEDKHNRRSMKKR